MIDLRKKKDFTAEVFTSSMNDIMFFLNAVLHYHIHAAQSKHDKGFFAEFEKQPDTSEEGDQPYNDKRETLLREQYAGFL